MSTAALLRSVRLTARTSALLFAAAQATPALRPGAARAARRLYLGFLAAHAVHFTVVARYATVTKGRNLFPGGRSLADAGGWPTVAAIYTAFAGLAVTGWAARAGATGGPALRRAGRTATTLIGVLFVGVYLGRLRESAWYAVPATIVGGAVAAGVIGRPRLPVSR